MSYLKLVVDNAPSLACAVTTATHKVQQADAVHDANLEANLDVAFELILNARVTKDHPTVREMVHRANAYLYDDSKEIQDCLTYQMVDLLRVGLLLDASLSPDFPVHCRIQDTQDLIRWLPALRPYRHLLKRGVTFA